MKNRVKDYSNQKTSMYAVQHMIGKLHPKTLTIQLPAKEKRNDN